MLSYVNICGSNPDACIFSRVASISSHFRSRPYAAITELYVPFSFSGRACHLTPREAVSAAQGASDVAAVWVTTDRQSGGYNAA
jgi:hypothetical protein